MGQVDTAVAKFCWRLAAISLDTQRGTRSYMSCLVAPVMIMGVALVYMWWEDATQGDVGRNHVLG